MFNWYKVELPHLWNKMSSYLSAFVVHFWVASQPSKSMSLHYSKSSVQDRHTVTLGNLHCKRNDAQTELSRPNSIYAL